VDEYLTETPASRGAIVAAATKNAISPATTDRYLKRLSEAGVIASGSGLYWLKTA